MQSLHRRTFVVGAACAWAAFGLNAPIAVDAATLFQKTPNPNPGFFRYRIGEAECTALYDGIWEKVHEPDYFKNASVEETKAALTAGGLPSDFVPISITMLAIRLKGKLILCDTGGGGQIQAFNPKSLFVSGKMIVNMKAAGIDPAAVETILISHFHPDHIFGLLSKEDDAPVFPNAEIIVPASEYKWWTDPALIARLPEKRRRLGKRIQRVIPSWKNVLPVGGEDEVVPGIRFVQVPGHTPGHTAFHLSSGSEQLMISNDTVYVPALVAAHPGWQGAFDQDVRLAETSRRKLMERVVEEKMLICGAHFPWPGIGHMAREGEGYRFMLGKSS